MANIENLQPGNVNHTLTPEEAQKGGIRSGEVRREKATMKKQLEAMLSSTNNKGKQYSDLVSLGLIANAIDKNKGGNPRAYEMIVRMLGEIDKIEETSTPQVNINIIDNSNLEGAMYEDNNQ